MMKSPITRMVAVEAMNSMVVSFFLGGAATLFSVTKPSLANDGSCVWLAYNGHGAAPASVAEHAHESVGEPGKFSIPLGSRIVQFVLIILAIHRPVDQQRLSHYVFLRHESPIAAVETV